MDEFKKQLKIQAMKAAKDKAGYMLVAVDEKLGALIELNEQDYQPIEFSSIQNGKCCLCCQL